MIPIVPNKTAENKTHEMLVQIGHPSGEHENNENIRPVKFWIDKRLRECRKDSLLM